MELASEPYDGSLYTYHVFRPTLTLSWPGSQHHGPFSLSYPLRPTSPRHQCAQQQPISKPKRSPPSVFMSPTSRPVGLRVPHRLGHFYPPRGRKHKWHHSRTSIGPARRDHYKCEPRPPVRRACETLPRVEDRVLLARPTPCSSRHQPQQQFGRRVTSRNNHEPW